jgi:hypothetical protein
MEQIARSATQESWGYLNPCRYVLHDRAERWVRSVKQECLSKLVLVGEGPLRRSLTEFMAHYHLERNHKGKGNKLLTPLPEKKGRKIRCQQRLGGLLKFYARAA